MRHCQNATLSVLMALHFHELLLVRYSFFVFFIAMSLSKCCRMELNYEIGNKKCRLGLRLDSVDGFAVR